MRMIKYITLDQLIYWAETTPPFIFNGVSVNPATQWSAVSGSLLPLLNGSLDNPYSTTTPKEKLPLYFTSGTVISSYLNQEYADRLVATPYRVGEFYPRLNKNLTKDEAMEVIMQEIVGKAVNFINLYKILFVKKIGLASIKYNPIWNVDGTEKTIYDFGLHVTTDQYGNKQLTQLHGALSRTNNYGQVQLTDQFGKTTEEIEYGNTSQTTQFGALQLTDLIGGTTDTHSETLMNDLTFKNKALDTHSGHTDTHSATQHSDTTTATTHTDTREVGQHSDTHTTAARTDSESKGTYTDTITDATHTDTNTSLSHLNVETKERHGNIGVTSTLELIRLEIGILDFNPAIELFEAFINKMCLRTYCY